MFYFLLIAGTYTPYTLVSLNGTLGFVMFGVIWAVAILGIILNTIDLNKYKVFSMILYVMMGWAIVVSFNPLINNLGINGIYLLLGGGVMYTVGIVFYALEKKYKYMHSIWHLFVLGASILHFFLILLYVI